MPTEGLPELRSSVEGGLSLDPGVDNFANGPRESWIGSAYDIDIRDREVDVCGFPGSSVAAEGVTTDRILEAMMPVPIGPGWGI